jgi:hypothetical protein
LESYSFVQAIRGSFVQQIEPAKEALSMEGSTQNLNREFIYNPGKFPEKIKGKLGERKDCLLISVFG